MIWTDSAIPNKPERRKHAAPCRHLRRSRWHAEAHPYVTIMAERECQNLLSEFRENLEAFYAALKLAPPYDSVEKTIRCLSDLFKSRTAEEQAQVLGDKALKRQLHVQAVVDSGLHKKHRGIIAGLARTDAIDQFPESVRYLLEPFRS